MLAILSSVVERGERSNSLSRHIAPREKAPFYSFHVRLNGPQSLMNAEAERKSSAFTGRRNLMCNITAIQYTVLTEMYRLNLT